MKRIPNLIAAAVLSGIGTGLQAEYIAGMESNPYDPDNLVPGMFVGEVQDQAFVLFGDNQGLVGQPRRDPTAADHTRAFAGAEFDQLESQELILTEYQLFPEDLFPPEGPYQLCDPIRPMVLYPGLDDETFPCLEWKRHVYWISPQGQRQALTQQQWDRLNQLFGNIVMGTQNLGLNCPDPNTSLHYMTAKQAEDVYLAHVAHALALEYNGALPWKLRDLPAAELAEILSPEAYHQPIPNNSSAISYPSGMGPGVGYRLPFRQSQAGSMVCDPRQGYRFMTGNWPGQGNSLLGQTPEETLQNLTAWARDELGHGDGDWNTTKQRALLKDRLVRYHDQKTGITTYWAIHGCQSATNTLADLARAVNIPLLRVGTRESGTTDPVQTHAGLVFRWSRTNPLVLHHADELYAIQEDWVVTPEVGGASVTPGYKDELFFRNNWLDPSVLIDLGVDYKLTRVLNSQGSSHTCTSSFFCDVVDYGWHIGGWKFGDREKPNYNQAVAKWEAYFKTLKSWIMSDGKPCFDPATWYHKECLPQVEVEHDKIFGQHYLNERMRGYWLVKNAELGGYTLLQRQCDYNFSNADWQQYVDDEQGQPTPWWAQRGWQWYRDKVATTVQAYGGCSAVSNNASQVHAHKKRP